MIFRRFIPCATFIVLLACSIQSIRADGRYPDNPLQLDQDLVLSASGLRRINLRNLQPIWTALPGIDTFEPVATGQHLLIGSRRGVHAIDRDSGRVLWSQGTDTTLFSPAVAHGRAFVGGMDGSIRALALASGEPLWRRRVDGWVYTPAVAGDVLVVGGEAGRIHGLSTIDGTTRWARELDQQLVHRPVATPAGIVTTTFSGDIRLLDPRTGEPVWRVRAPVASFSPVVADTRLYFGRYDGRLDVRALTDGRLLWSDKLNGRLSLPVTFHDAHVIATSPEGEIAAFDRRTGRPFWRCQLDGELIASTLVAEGGWFAFTQAGPRRFDPGTCRLQPHSPEGGTE